MAKHPQQYVYVLDGGERGSKIGSSTFVRERTRNQQGDGKFVRAWHRPHDAREVEKVAHDILGRDVRHGAMEWFSVPASKAIEVVEKAIFKCDQGFKRRGQSAQASIRSKQRRDNYKKIKRAVIEGYDAACAADATPDVTATKNMYGFMIGIFNEIEDGVPAREIFLGDLETQPRRDATST